VCIDLFLLRVLKLLRPSGLVMLLFLCFVLESEFGGWNICFWRDGRIDGVYDPTLRFEMLLVKVVYRRHVSCDACHMPEAFWRRLARSTYGVEVEEQGLLQERLWCRDTELKSAA
jgi:hypothetical protein